MSFVKQSNLLPILIFTFILTFLLSGCTQNNAETSSNVDTSSKDESVESQTEESEIIDDDGLWSTEINLPDGFDDGEEYLVSGFTFGLDPMPCLFAVAVQSKLTATLSAETFTVYVSYCYFGTQEKIDERYSDYKAVLELRVNDQVIPLKELDLSRFIADGHKLYLTDNGDTVVYDYPEGELFNISTDLMQPYNGKYKDYDDNFSICISLYDGEKLYVLQGTSVYYHREDDEIKFFSNWVELDDYLISIGEKEAE